MTKEIADPVLKNIYSVRTKTLLILHDALIARLRQEGKLKINM